ncbi:unnamed protein product, partial [Ectocarpus sp. 12 AP-2014]
MPVFAHLFALFSSCGFNQHATRWMGRLYSSKQPSGFLAPAPPLSSLTNLSRPVLFRPCTRSAKGFSCSECASLSSLPRLRLILPLPLCCFGHGLSRCSSLNPHAGTNVSHTTVITMATWTATRTTSNTLWLLDRSSD